MRAPKMQTVQVTTVQEMLKCVTNGNHSALAAELEINRGTLRKLVDTDRVHHVLVNDDGSFTLLK